MTPKQQKQAIERDAKKAQRKAATALVKKLKGDVGAARVAKREAAARAKADCKVGRDEARAHVDALRAELRIAIQTELQAARQACVVGISTARALTGELAQRRAALAAEKRFQADMRMITRHNAEKFRELAKTRGKRGAASITESDDEVRQSIPEDLIPLFERVKRGIKGSPLKSRTEAFLEYVEEHPRERNEAIDEATEAKMDAIIQEMEARQAAVDPQSQDTGPWTQRDVEPFYQDVGEPMRHQACSSDDADPYKLGIEHAQEQLDSEHFQSWVWDQMHEDVPGGKITDPRQIAKNMLQQLVWDTDRQLDPRDVIGHDATREDVREFWKGFREGAESGLAWLTEIVREHLDEQRIGVSEAHTIKKTVELYNLFMPGNRSPTNGFLVRVVKNGRTIFVRFGRDEHGARAFAADPRDWNEWRVSGHEMREAPHRSSRRPRRPKASNDQRAFTRAVQEAIQSTGKPVYVVFNVTGPYDHNTYDYPLPMPEHPRTFTALYDAVDYAREQHRQGISRTNIHLFDGAESRSGELTSKVALRMRDGQYETSHSLGHALGSLRRR